MSELDVREVKLQPRYPESRQEDITDAYMRGFESVIQVTDKLITRLNKENAELRKLVLDMLRQMPCSRPCSRCERYRYPEGCEFEIRRRELGVEL